MIYFSGCKINLGLHVIERRDDGFHNIETVFYAITELCDVVEILTSDSPTSGLEFSTSGLSIDCPVEKNLCAKAYRLLENDFDLPGTRLHLHKHIPFGAGLGGGSANAAAVLRGVNEMYNLGLDREGLLSYANMLGSDTAYFIHGNMPMLGRGRGEILETVMPNIPQGLHILLAKPDVGVSTAVAYSMVRPTTPTIGLAEIVAEPIDEWQGKLINDFELPIFEHLPLLAEIKRAMYDAGAIYASMSGSGSTIFGIFAENPASLAVTFPYFTHCEPLRTDIDR